MPQMKPMNWMILFMLTNMIILLMNIKNYYMINKMNFYKNNINKNMNFKNWKW